MSKNSKKFILTIIFWALLALIGLGAIIAGAIIKNKTGNNLMWLPISLGIICLAIGTFLTTYLSIVEYKRKYIRSKGI